MKQKKQKKSPKQPVQRARRMTLRDIFSLSTRTFKTRPLRTSLTILGMSVGIGAVLFLVSFGFGLQETILNRITTADALLSLDVSTGNSEFIRLDQEHVNRISDLEYVAEVSPVSAISSQITLGELTGIVTMYSVTPSFFGLSGVVPSHGTLFSPQLEGEEYRRELVVSSAMVMLFGMEPDIALGQEVFVMAFVPHADSDGNEEVFVIEIDEPFTIVAIVDDDKESFVYAPSGALSEIQVDTFIGLKVKVVDAAYMELVRDDIIGMGFFVSALQDTIDQVKKIFRIVQIVLGLFGFIALTVSAIGMFNTMTVLLLERTNEIGIMRSIGVTRRDVRKLFVFEAMFMGFLGGLGGVALGYVAGFLANFGINILAQHFGGQAINLFSYSLTFVFVIIAFSTVIGLLTGIFPAHRAAKINPLEALRYK